MLRLLVQIPAAVRLYRSMPVATVGLILATAGCGGTPEAIRGPEPGSASECCRELVYVYEASIFKLDVMRIRVRVDEATAEAVRSLVHSRPRSADLDGAVAARFMAAQAATAVTEFLMGMSGETFIANTIKSMDGMARDGRVTDGEAQALGRDVRSRFGFLSDTGVRPTDRLHYDLVGDTVTTRYLRADTVLMRDRQVGALHRTVLLSSYFTPSSEFRRGLLDEAFGR